MNYCAVIYQVDTEEGIKVANMAKAYSKASREGITAVNISIEGIGHNFIEKLALEDLTSRGVIVFIAAGNRSDNLSETCNSYPACYRVPNTVVVGASALEDPDHRAGYSNYGGLVTAWYPGAVTFGGEHMQGTSFAAPRALADFVYSLVTLPILTK